MAKPRHKQDTKTFEQLTLDEQRKSIMGQISVLQRSIVHYVNACKPATKRTKARNQCLKQVSNLMGRLIDKTQ